MYSKTTNRVDLLEPVPDALVGMDRAGAIRFVNHQTELLFGYDHDDLVGRHIETLAPESLWPTYLQKRDEDFDNPKTSAAGLDLNLNARHRDGTDLKVTVNLSRFDTDHLLLTFRAVRDVALLRQVFENSQRMAALVEYSHDAIVTKTMAGIITGWNPAAERIYGYSSEEIIGKPIQILAPEDRSCEITAILDRIAAGESVEHFETVRVRKDGSLFAASISVSPIRDQDGVIIGASKIARDVTEQRGAFEAARAMIESSQDPLVSLNSEGTITDANEAMVEITGVSRAELIGVDFSQYFTDPEKAHEVYESAFANGGTKGYPLTVRHVDGTLTDFLFNASVHRGSAGNVLAVFAAARDNTKVRQAFESTRAMIESSLDSLVSISPEGEITDLNEATVKVTGRPRSQLIGTAFSDYFTEPEKANQIYQKVFAEGMAVDYPLTMRHVDGTLTDVLYNASVYRDVNGSVRGVFAAARDVTKQTRAQREFAEQQAKGLERLAELERFQRLTVGRELQMIELKKEIEYLRKFAPTERDESDPGQ